ncbi:hypothetical protein Tco_1378451 [Tanacetum coccineum]
MFGIVGLVFRTDRKKGQEANPYKDYREFPSVFCLRYNHGVTTKPSPMTRYNNGRGVGIIVEEVGQSSRNGSGSENGSGSDSGSDSEDSDYFVDEENLIEDVDVDMAEFKRHTDPGVEWLGCKENVLEENEVFELEEDNLYEFAASTASTIQKFDKRMEENEKLQLYATIIRVGLTEESHKSTPLGPYGRARKQYSFE